MTCNSSATVVGSASHGIIVYAPLIILFWCRCANMHSLSVIIRTSSSTNAFSTAPRSAYGLFSTIRMSGQRTANPSWSDLHGDWITCWHHHYSGKKISKLRKKSTYPAVFAFISCICAKDSYPQKHIHLYLVIFYYFFASKKWAY